MIIRCLLFATFLSFSSCTNVLYYGYLPGGKFKYYEPITKVDLNSKRINLIVEDKRDSNTKIKCSEIDLDRKTELEVQEGFQYFKNYCRAMIEFNGGIFDTTGTDTLRIFLSGLSAKYYGFGYVKVYGLVEFQVNGLGIEYETYCSEMVDGDEDAPLKSYSVTTRKAALRKMVSGSTRRALEEMIQDINAESPAR